MKKSNLSRRRPQRSGRNPGLALMLFAALMTLGCPRAADRREPPAENVLPIPPLGTDFTYDREEANWSFAPHPRILARPEGIEMLRGEGAEGLAGELTELARLHRELIETDPSYREAVGPIACAWGYLLTGEEGYVEAVRSSLGWLLNFPPLVRAPEGANIAFLQQAYALGGVYDLLYDEWTDEERDRIETVLKDTVFHTLAYKVTCYDEAVNFWALDPDTNYYLVFHSTAGLVAIVLAGVHPDAEALAEHCWNRVQLSMDAFAEENGWREGLTYLDFCWGQSACYFLLALERNSDLRPYDHPWFEPSALWAATGALPDRATIACFGDNEPENYSVGSYLGRVAGLTGDEWFLQECKATAEVVEHAMDIPIFGAACLGRAPTALSFHGEDIGTKVAYRFEGIEWGVIRSGPEGLGWEDEDDFYCAFKSGVAGYDHNHLDQGSLILGAYSEVLLSDPGRGGPDTIRHDPYINCLFEAGLGHNTLIVGDGCYMDLGLFPDNPKYFAEPGRITSQVEEEDYYIQFITDNSGLYATEPVTDFKRTFLYIKPGMIEGAELGALLILDRVEFHEPVQHSILFHTPGLVETTDTGVAKIINGGARLDYWGLCTQPDVDRIEKQETSMSIRDSTCYYRSTEEPVIASDWLHVLIPARVGDPEPPRLAVTMSARGFDLEWESCGLMLVVHRDLGWGVLPTRPIGE